jgi:dipeptidyl aminopeptidase/acylaminoacyl peptidase
MSSVVRSLALAAALLAASAVMVSQNPSSSKPTVTKADYDKFESISGSALSPDGKWVAYGVTRGERGAARGRGSEGPPPVLHYRAIASDDEKTISGGGSPAFTANSRWLIYTLSPAGGGNGGRRGGGGRGGRGNSDNAANGSSGTNASIGVVDLSSGRATVFQDVQSYTLSSDGHHVALRRPLPEGSQNRGAGLVIRDLETGVDVSFGNIAESAWSDDGATLAMIVDVAGKTGNGVQALNTATGALRSLDSSDMTYSNLRWRKKGDDLAVHRSLPEDPAYSDTGHTVLAWRGVSSSSSKKFTYDSTADSAFPKGMRVSSDYAPLWTDDGGSLFFGIAPQDPKPATPGERGTGPNPAKVQIWHAKDLREWPQQKNSATQDLQRTHLVVWHPGDNGIVRLADDELPTVQLSENRKLGLAGDEKPYFTDVITGRQYRDVYTIDAANGKRVKVLTKAQVMPTMSPSGRYLLYTIGDTKSGAWLVMDLEKGTTTNLTSKIPSVFVNMEDDHPVPYRRAYGNGGWLAGEKAVLLYDRFDVWQVSVDGSNPLRLTRGKEDSTVYRIDRAGSEDPTIDPAQPILLTATGEYSKKSGFSRVTIGKTPERLLWEDKAIGGLIKAKNADVYALTKQTFTDSSQVYVASAPLNDAKQISHTNEFLKDFAWGKQTLMDYTNKRGDKLQMMLTYPANYVPGKKYPMVVYYYEKLSQGFHSFVVPGANAMYNTTVFSQNGYFVLRPDIIFQPRNAGPSGLDCVTSAVKTALSAVPDIDSKKVGAMGHSWGGYQSAYYAVHGGDVFAAAIAGAPLTDFISMYGYSSGNTGAPEVGHFEPGQERMEVSLWEDPEAYIRNSTVFQANQLRIPLLLEEGDSDGNVNYYQSMELYNFGRRLGKNVVFLVYEGENHGLTGDAAGDYAQRQLEWFGHYLKGEPALEWIAKGEPYLTRKKILDSANPPQPGANTPGARGARGRGGS